MNNIRKACVEAIFREFEDHGDAISPACGDLWDEIEARRSLGHIVGYVDLDVADLVMQIEDELGVSIELDQSVTTMKDLIAKIEEAKNA